MREAVLNGKLEEVKKILNLNNEVINLPDTGGYTALHHAVENVCFNIVKELIRKGAELNIYNYHGLLPIHQAFDNEAMEKL